MPIERFAYHWINAVCSDHVVLVHACPIGERENNAIASLLQADESVSKMDRATIKLPREGFQGNLVVKGIIRSSILLRIFKPIAEFEKFPRLKITLVNPG